MATLIIEYNTSDKPAKQLVDYIKKSGLVKIKKSEIAKTTRSKPNKTTLSAMADTSIDSEKVYSSVTALMEELNR